MCDFCTRFTSEKKNELQRLFISWGLFPHHDDQRQLYTALAVAEKTASLIWFTYVQKEGGETVSLLAPTSSTRSENKRLHTTKYWFYGQRMIIDDPAGRPGNKNGGRVTPIFFLIYINILLLHAPLHCVILYAGCTFISCLCHLILCWISVLCCFNFGLGVVDCYSFSKSMEFMNCLNWFKYLFTRSLFRNGHPSSFAVYAISFSLSLSSLG